MRKLQQTIASTVSVRGIGLHSGEAATLTFLPAEPGRGVVFIRTDLDGRPEVPASVEMVRDTMRGTTIGTDSGAFVRTVEHVLSALAGLEVDNCVIEIDGEEPPICDGSSAPFVDLLAGAGFTEQPVPRRYIEITEELTYNCEETQSSFTASPAATSSATAMIDYGAPVIPIQSYAFSFDSASYRENVAPARTFCLLSEVEQLRRRGLIRGGSLKNAVVILDKELTEDERAFFIPNSGGKLAGNTDIYLQVEPLRFGDELARHKVLDLVGDLALLGMPILGHVSAIRPGHRANVEFARYLKKQAEAKSLVRQFPAPLPTNGPMDINDIKRVLPHRYPFLLVDRILEVDVEASRIVGMKNVTANEPFFQGHFPGYPIMPGVLIVEAMAQTGGLLLMNEVVDGSKLALFMGIREAKFRKPVFPGDTLRFEVELKGKRFNTYTLAGKALVNDVVVAQAEIAVAVIDRAQAGA